MNNNIKESKIEIAKKLKSQYLNLKDDIAVALNRGNYNKDRYDKSAMRLSTSDRGGDMPWYAPFELKFGYGTWGSSDFYGSNSKFSAELFAEIVNEFMPQIADRMIAVAKSRYEMALKDAEKEAEAILKAIKEDE